MAVSFSELMADSDSFTQDIYDVSEDVEMVLKFEIFRACVDVSRAPDSLAPEHKDGVIKSATCHNRSVYKNGMQPGESLVNKLIDKYYRPYHESIRTALTNQNVQIALDCHSMAEIAPAVAPDKGARPLINLGDVNGLSCAPKITHLLRKSFIEVFKIEKKDVLINSPFKGGYITKTYGNNSKPWIQIEMNRSLYLSKNWFGSDQVPQQARLDELKDKFKNVLIEFNKKLTFNIESFRL